MNRFSECSTLAELSVACRDAAKYLYDETSKCAPEEKVRLSTLYTQRAELYWEFSEACERLAAIPQEVEP